MDDPSYEPMFDSKWAIPFIAALLLFMVLTKGLLRFGLFFARRNRGSEVVHRATSCQPPAIPQIRP